MPEEIEQRIRIVVLVKVLMQRAYHVSPRLWVPLVLELERLLAESETVGRVLDKTWPEDLTVGEASFMNRITAMTDIADLEEIFAALSEIDAKTRRRLLLSCRTLTGDYQLIVNEGWLQESKQTTLDGVEAAERYSRLAE